MNDLKEDIRNKYVAKALEGYEQNYQGVSEAITQINIKLKEFIQQRDEMVEGIREMKEILGLTEEEKFPPLATLESIDEE